VGTNRESVNLSITRCNNDRNPAIAKPHVVMALAKQTIQAAKQTEAKTSESDFFLCFVEYVAQSMDRSLCICKDQ